jgi:hypothetical protein
MTGFLRKCSQEKKLKAKNHEPGQLKTGRFLLKKRCIAGSERLY